MDWILTFSIISGQLIKLPLLLGGVTFLDFAIIIISSLLIVKNRFRLKNPPLYLKAGAIFVLVCIISQIFTPLKLTLPEYINAYLYTLRFALFLIFAWTIYSFISINPAQVLKSSGIILAFLGLLQLIFLPDLIFLQENGWDPHYFRTVSTFLDPNFLGAYLVLTLLLIFQSTPNFKFKIFAFTLVYIALLTTFSRSSYLMFLASFTTISYFKNSKILFLKTLMLFLILMIGFWGYTRFVAAPRGVNREASASYRISTWQQGLSIFQRSPLLGIGFNSYRYAIREYNLGNSQFLNTRGSTTNDFSLLYVLTTTGILGLTSYLFFLGSIIYKTRKNLLVIPILAGLLIHSFFSNSLFYPFILVWIIILPMI